jgi:hypothetical protein
LPFTPAGIVDNIDAFDSLADTIANPPPDKPLSGAIGRAGQKYCDYLGALPGAASGLLGPGMGVGALLCDPYWKDKNYSPPVEGPPFTGGQCAGVLYRIVYSWSLTRLNCNGSAATPLTSGGNITLNNRVGPISWADTSVYNACGDGRRSDGSITLTSASNTDKIGAALGAGYITSITINIAVSRMDNAPDTCGNPTGPAFRPGPSPPPRPTFPPGEEPGVDPDGQPFFVVPDIPGPIVTEPPIEVPPPSTGPGEPGGDPGPPEGESGAPVTATPGDDAEGEADEGKELVGLRVDIVTFPPNANPVAPGLYRGVCYAFMGNDSGLDLDPAGALIGDGQLILAERPRLTKWRVTANIGYNLSVTPYYRTIET